MLDIKYIRENLSKVKEALSKKRASFDLECLVKLDDKRKDVQKRVELLRAEANKAAKDNDVEKGKKIKQMLKDLVPQAQEAEEAYLEEAVKVPNIPSKDTPEGESEKDNKVLRSWGEKPKLSFKAKEHFEIGKELDIIDTERAAKVSGARFYYLKGKLALLQMALVQYGFSVLTDENILKEIIKKANLKVSSKPFIPVIPPVIVKSDTLYKMARLEPRDERYHIEKGDLFLVGSAEHSLGAMHMDEILDEKDLPLRYAGYSAAFRREAGSYGKDLKGMFRVHQFDKLEMETFCLPQDSTKEQDFIIAIQEYFMQSLKLPYQVVQMCTGDMGTPDARQIDIEAWLPGQNKYRETHTSDLMTDYQARRLNTKVRQESGEKVFVHMNDATGFAMRTLIAILENYQQKDGSVKIPEVLQKYTNFKEISK